MPSPDPDRPHLTCKAAGRRLGVDLEVVRGLVTAGKAEGFRDRSHHGVDMWFIYADEVERLKALMQP